MGTVNQRWRIGWPATLLGSLAVLTTGWLARPVYAASVTVDPAASAVAVGDEFSLVVRVASEGDAINAIEGAVVFPSALVAIREVREAGSVVSFWVNPPTAAAGRVTFSGIIAGGYSGRSGELFTMIFSAQAAGRADFTLQNVTALRNDGLGTSVSLTTSRSTVTISPPTAIAPAVVAAPSDADPPEPFAIELASDPAIFSGQWFAVFAAHDKGSGIDHYEVAETHYDPGRAETILAWQTTSSPYLLQDQARKSYLVVKAVDRAGNAQQAVVPPLSRYQKTFPWGMIGAAVALLIAAVIVWRLFSRPRLP